MTETIQERYGDEYIQHQGLGRDGTPLLVPEMLADVGTLLDLIGEVRKLFTNWDTDWEMGDTMREVMKFDEWLDQVEEVVG